MSIKSRLDRLEQRQNLTESAEDIPESLSPFEKYKRMINTPIKPIKADTTKPSRSFSSSQEAYALMTGRDHELS